MAKKEIHNAIVTRNIESDPDSTLRLRGAVYFDSPTLFDGEFPLPALPCFQFASLKGAGIFFVPKVGDEIEVEIESDDGTSDTSDVELPEPRWRCMIYSDPADIADEFKKNYPARMGWKSNSGHLLMFDDFEGQRQVLLRSQSGHELILDELKGQEKIRLKSAAGHQFILDDKKGTEQIQMVSKGGHAVVLDDTSGNESIHIIHKSGALIQIIENGSITLLDKEGGYISLNTEEKEISIVTPDGANISMNADQVAIIDKTGKQIITLTDDSIAISADSEVSISAPNLSVNSSFTAIGGLFAIFSAVLGENNSAYLSTHFHLAPQAPVGILPTTPPVISPFLFTGTPLDTNALFIKLRGNI